MVWTTNKPLLIHRISGDVFFMKLIVRVIRSYRSEVLCLHSYDNLIKPGAFITILWLILSSLKCEVTCETARC